MASSSSKALFLTPLLHLAFVLLSFSFAQAGEVLVGGNTDAWKLSASGSDSLAKWAGKARFRIGDSLVWKQNGTSESVLQVSESDYKSCNTTRPVEEYKLKEGEDVKVKLERSGPFFFISGEKGECEKGQKMSIVVVSPRNGLFLAPSPAPVSVDGPAVAPTSGAGGSGAALVVVVAALAFGALALF